MKEKINRFLRTFNLELHGCGYLQKLRSGQVDKDAYRRQQELLSGATVEHVIDAGANRGRTADRYLSLFPQAKVHCFEPTPAIAAELSSRFADNSRVQVSEVALSDRAGVQTLNINTSQDTNSLLGSTKINATSDELCRTVDSVDVQTMTLDAYADANQLSRIGLLKMDVQGSEINLLEGSRKLLSGGSIDLIYTETYFQRQYENQPLFGDLSKFLEGFQFELIDLFDPYYNSDCLLWCDAVFRRKTAGK